MDTDYGHMTMDTDYRHMTLDTDYGHRLWTQTIDT